MPTLATIALGLAGCGGGTTKQASTDTTVSSITDKANSTATSARKARARLPGPPGPSGPPAISDAIATWHPLVEAGVPNGQCRPLLDSVRGKLGRDAADDAGGPRYVSLYKGIAEGCLGELQAARNDLGQARQVGLGPDETSKDTTCNAQLLLVFGFDTYLDQQIGPACPRPTSTTREATSTTGQATSTTRASTTTTSTTR
ncbi:MAG TPA: hypothetical protein VF711_04015 [Acidimicrobiales bacterium]